VQGGGSKLVIRHSPSHLIPWSRLAPSPFSLSLISPSYFPLALVSPLEHPSKQRCTFIDRFILAVDRFRPESLSSLKQTFPNLVHLPCLPRIMGKWATSEYDRVLLEKVKQLLCVCLMLWSPTFCSSFYSDSFHHTSLAADQPDTRFTTFIRNLDPNDRGVQACFHSLIQVGRLPRSHFFLLRRGSNNYTIILDITVSASKTKLALPVQTSRLDRITGCEVPMTTWLPTTMRTTPIGQCRPMRLMLKSLFPTPSS